jgi:hypothetical protein
LHRQDDAAAQEPFGRFARQLIALAHRHIGAELRHKVDPEDVVQSAYKTFFFRYVAGKLDVVNWNSLWGLLTLITVRKCAERGSLQAELQRAVTYANDRAAAEEARANNAQLRATEREIAREQAGRYRAMSQEIGVGALTVGVIRGQVDNDIVRALNDALNWVTQRATAYRNVAAPLRRLRAGGGTGPRRHGRRLPSLAAGAGAAGGS